ncbi:MAG: NAD(P)-binding protein [Acidimicrobiia bacterium]
MGRVVMIGGGLVGSLTAMMLARDGHDVEIFERDASIGVEPQAAWHEWDRKGVGQFRLPHYLLPRLRSVLDAELPDVAACIAANGGLRFNMIDKVPTAVSGGRREGDERFETLTGRRPFVEACVRSILESHDGITVSRDTAITGLLASPVPGREGIPHVYGVRTERGDDVVADLVVDACGRRSVVPDWLRSIGSTGPAEDVADSGFRYYSRHFRSSDGSHPPMRSGLNVPIGTIGVLTLPADNGTWGCVITTSAGDRELRALADAETFSRVWSLLPAHAHWLDGEPIDDVTTFAKIEDRRRRYVVDDRPVVTGLVPIGDSWACTNPSLGRGISFGALHGQLLRDTLRDTGFSEPYNVVVEFAERAERDVAPYVEDTLNYDRHRLAEIDALRAGRPYETDDPAWNIAGALRRAASATPELFRGSMDVVSLLERGSAVVGRPGLFQSVLDHDTAETPAVSREQLVAAVSVG